MTLCVIAQLTLLPLPPSLPRPSGQTQQLWALAQQDKSKIGEIFGVENVEAVCRELEGEMVKMQKVESLANMIQKNKGRGEGEKRKEDEEAWRGWVKKFYLPRLGKEKEEGGGQKEEEERGKVRRRTRRGPRLGKEKEEGGGRKDEEERFQVCIHSLCWGEQTGFAIHSHPSLPSSLFPLPSVHAQGQPLFCLAKLDRARCHRSGGETRLLTGAPRPRPPSRPLPLP